ncbi:MAG: hypothetical protein QOJ81_485 [Chloroflexota bacterium]|jgi:hypothetical protein|nr:hypothetical protein [Chloroflexota bacterium]
MTTNKTDRFIESFLSDGVDQLPDHVYVEVRDQIDRTRQRVAIGPWKEEQMSRFAWIALAAAAVVLFAVVGIRFLPTTGVGVEPTPSASPTAAPSPAGTPIVDPTGRLQPGTYVAHPFDSLLGMDARGFTFTTPSANWETFGETGMTRGVAWNPGNGDSAGVGVGFLKVHSLNGDACHWAATDDDIEIGPTVDDLLEALANASTFEAVDTPYPEQVSNVTGQGIEIAMPAAMSVEGCDEQAYRIWNAEGFDIYAQGPSNVWRLGVFDVDGERYIVMASYMPDTPDRVRNEMMSIFRSVVIDPSPGCPQYSALCN